MRFPLARAFMWLGLLGSVAIGISSPSFAGNGPQVEHFTLANGLEVYVIPNHRIPAVSHMMWYRIGAADDPQGKSGLAHFHEHMMFKATGKLKTGEYTSVIASHGGQHNAFTNYDATSYYVDIAKENLPLVMELEADRMRGLRPSDEDAAKEKQVIIEERRQRIENNPDALLSEQVSAALFRHHPYHLPVIGWLHEMEGLTKNDVLDFHETYYHPNNAILVVSGDITAEQLKPLAQKYYGALKPAKIPARRWNKEPPQLGARRITLHHINVKQPTFSRTYATDSLNSGNSANALPLYLLSQVLTGGRSSRLYQSIAMEQKLATQVDANYNPLTMGPSEFSIDLIPENNISLEKLESALDVELAKLLKDGISDAELARAKTQLKASSLFERDGLAQTARAVGWLVVSGQDISYFTQWSDKIDAITAEQVLTAARANLNMNASVTSFLLPEDKK